MRLFLSRIFCLFQSFKNLLQHHRRRNLTIGSLWNHQRTFTFNDLVGNNHITSDRQTVHKVSIVRHSHLAFAHSPVAVGREHLALVVASICSPVLGIDKIGTLESLHLIIFHAGIANESWVQFIAFWMSDDKIIIGSIHPLGK